LTCFKENIPGIFRNVTIPRDKLLYIEVAAGDTNVGSTPMTDARQPEIGLDFDKVWAVVQEIAKQIKETNEETDRRLQKSGEETDRKLRETAQLMQKLTKETNKQIGDLGGRFG
jgi:hypothetical protein